MSPLLSPPVSSFVFIAPRRVFQHSQLLFINSRFSSICMLFTHALCMAVFPLCLIYNNNPSSFPQEKVPTTSGDRSRTCEVDLFFLFFSHTLLSSFWASSVHRCRPFLPPGSCLQFFIAHRVQQSHSSSIFHRVFVANSRSRAFRKSICAQAKSPNEVIRVQQSSPL